MATAIGRAIGIPFLKKLLLAIVNNYNNTVRSDGGTVEALKCLNNNIKTLSPTNDLIDNIDLFEQRVLQRGGFFTGKSELRALLQRYVALGITPTSILTPYGIGQRKIFDYVKLIQSNVPENLLTRSEDFNLGWSWNNGSAGTITYNVAQNPLDSNFNAARIDVVLTNTQVTQLSQTRQLIANQIYCLSVYVKPLNNIGSILIRGDGGANNANLDYNFNTQVVTTSGAFVIQGYKVLLQNNWARLVLIFRPTSTNNYTINSQVIFSQPVGTSYLIAQPSLSETSFEIPYVRNTSTTIPLRPWINFTRASNGSRLNKNGLVENLRNEVLFSDNFGNAWWVKSSGMTVVKNQTGVYGEENGATLVTVGTGNIAHLIQSSSILESRVNATYSDYCIVKKGATPFVQMLVFGTTVTGGTTYANFNIDLGIVTIVGGNCIPYIKKLTNGFYLIGVTYTADTASTAHAVTIIPIPNATHGRGASYTGTGQSIILQSVGRKLGNFQSDIPIVLENSNENIPRVTWTPERAALLNEIQTTNYMPEGTRMLNWGIFPSGAGTITNPAFLDPEGNNNAILLTGVNDTGNFAAWRIIGNTIPNNTTVIASVFVKTGNHSIISINHANAIGTGGTTCYFNISTLTASIAGARVEDWGNGWYRCIMQPFTFTTAPGVDYNIAVYVTPSTSTNLWSSGLTGKTVYLWGAQVENAVQFPSFPILNETAASRTRQADSPSTEGLLVGNCPAGQNATFIFDVTQQYSSSTNNHGLTSQGGSGVNFILRGGQFWVYTSSGSLMLTAPATLLNNTRARYVIRKSGSDWTLFCNGVQYNTGTLGGDLNTFNTVLYSGYFSNTRLHEYTEYNVALSDAQCLTLSQL